MKRNRLESFNSIFFLLWLIIGAIIWVTDDSNYPLMIQKILSAIAMLSTLIVTTFFMCNYLLPNTITKNRIWEVVGQVIVISLFQALVLWLFQEGFCWLESQGIFPISDNTEDRGTFLMTIFNLFPVTFLVTLGFGGLKFYFEHSKLYEQHLTLQKMHLETQLQSLQAQINPHFMFNVLNHIHMLMQKDMELASSLLVRYSDILRYQLYGAEKETVSMEDEIRFMDNYIEVEKYRWKNTLDVTCRWEVEEGRAQIPPLLFITFIENAFKHVSRSKQQKGYIHIHLKQQRNELTFEIENSKSTVKKKTDTDSGIGLENAGKRLEILYPGKHELSFSETEAAYHLKLIIRMDHE